MSTIRQPFDPECWYHVFNHSRGSDDIFESDYDFVVFLNLVTKYILPVAEVYAYCLMPNHFHFLVRYKKITIPDSFAKKIENDYYAHQWGNVQNTYTKKKNFRTGKRGGLFCQSINRNLIESEEYRQMCIVYIHNNPVKHGYCLTPEDWQYSSYKTIISYKTTNIDREKVISWFCDRQNFIMYHKSNASDIFEERFKFR